ncbi:DUF4197 domain-containing protein [uncultured Christiangramia sp.]|uniref:DUF4197 domain-containing protein n=1 Tax=uncultured Christiangramia sp. TaxID=503836 RepID=UPI002625E143|nr:DUF4197 domain-containing protein [uncultured Christiangramia sp.]
MKKLLGLILVFSLSSCTELQQIATQIPSTYGVTDSEINSGLKQALQFGIDKEVTSLATKDGFFKNELVRISLPPELQKVDRTLRDVGLDDLADEGMRVLNRAAEDAVGEAIPVFASAVKEISFADARNILLGADNAATSYLSSKTETQLYNRFNPIINKSLEKVGANRVWSNLIQRYNAIPLTSKVNPDLTDYVTNEALQGVFLMIEKEEKDIRNSLSSRTTDLLKRVFALQDRS